MCGRYPDVLPREKRRNFRKRAKDLKLWTDSFLLDARSAIKIQVVAIWETLDKIKSRYYWPNQYVFVEKQVSQLAGIFY